MAFIKDKKWRYNKGYSSLFRTEFFTPHKILFT